MFVFILQCVYIDLLSPVESTLRDPNVIILRRPLLTGSQQAQTFFEMRSLLIVIMEKYFLT